jgi:osmoprotectant transport system substrate-binding protein
MKRSVLWKILSMLLILFFVVNLIGCNQQDDKVTLKIGAQNYAEVIIMAYMAEALIEAETDYEVEVISRLASAMVLDQAMQTGDVDIASLFFTGGATGLLHPKISPSIENIRDPKWRDATVVFDFVKSESEKVLSRRWLEPLGYENTYAVTVRRETAEKYNLKKISDLKNLSNTLLIGMDDAYMDREVDGYKPLLSTYGLDPFKKSVSMQINLLYQAIRDGQVDVGVAYSSDARIHAFDLVWLEDDLDFFPPFEAAYAINLSALEKAPEIEAILSKLSGQIDIATIRKLNYEVDIDHKDHKEAAIGFLKEKGWIK